MPIPTAEEKLKWIKVVPPTQEELDAVAKLSPGDYEIGFQRTNDILDEALEIFLLEYRNPLRIQASRKHGRVAPSGDVWDLGGSESNNLVVEVLAKENIEIVEVSARSSKNKNGFHDGPHRAGSYSASSRFCGDFCCAGNHAQV